MNAPRSVTHETFAVERTYDAPPERVFQAWADPTEKASWFGGGEHDLDFRVGGTETNRGGPEGGPVFAFDARYQDIVPGSRIVYSYDMHLDEKRISVSLATVELSASGDGTRLLFTEQGAFLDGLDDAGQRRVGTEQLLDLLGEGLAGR